MNLIKVEAQSFVEDINWEWLGDMFDKDRSFWEWWQQVNREREEANEGGYDYNEPDPPYGTPKNKAELYFEWLEMEPTTDFAAIKKQYRKLMKKYHPDRFQDDDDRKATAQQVSSKLNEAYEFFQTQYD